MHPEQQAPVEAPANVARPDRRMTAGLGGGVALEWFDWNMYGLMAAFLAPHFFPSEDPATALLSALAVFGAGFFARPIGAALLGPVADLISHKRVMLISVAAMSATSLAVAVIPTYQTLGAGAGVMLLVLRLVQGLVTGAEAGVANAIGAELAPRGEEGRYLGLISGTFIQIGIFSASAVAFVVSAIVSPAAMADWAWRVPFAIAGLAGIAVLYLRKTLPETLVTRAVSRSYDGPERRGVASLWKTLWRARLALVGVVLVIGSIQIANYAWITGLPNLANSTYSENSTWVFALTTVMGVIWIVSGPIVGGLADRIGTARAFTAMRLALVPTFFFMLLYSEQNLAMFGLVMVLGGVVVGLNMSLYNYVAVTLMPREIRTTGVALGYALGVSIFGGTSSYLLVWLRSNGNFWLFAVYGAIVALVSVVVYYLARSRGHVHVGR
ncbi:MFS transporter [Nonomuraea sp. B5E05]|uniref:MFS transporter n=1 Tax=Nonomuraea sp. B5E05 TaxID=3153569 RepID=UPI003261CE67